MNRSPSGVFQTGLFGLAEVLSLVSMYKPTLLFEMSPVTWMASQSSADEKELEPTLSLVTLVLKYL